MGRINQRPSVCLHGACSVSANSRVIENPMLHDRITFLKTTAETEGEFVLFQVELAPGGGVLRHYHTTFTEEFTVLSGQLNVMVGKELLVLLPGQMAIIPKYAVHRFTNVTDAPVVFTTEVRPARTFEQSLRVSYGLAAAGKTTRQGIIKNPLLLGLHFQLAETYLPGIPLIVQKVGGGLLAALGRLFGQDKVFQTYL